MKKIIKYEIVSENSSLIANSKINRYIREGYQPYGPLTTNIRNHLTFTEIFYTQVMVLYETDTKNN